MEGVTASRTRGRYRPSICITGRVAKPNPDLARLPQFGRRNGNFQGCEREAELERQGLTNRAARRRV